MKERPEVPIYGCPFCDTTTRGTWKNPKMGALNLQVHVKSKHTDRLEEFSKTNMDDYIVDIADTDEPIKNEEPPAFEKLQQPPKIPVPVSPPIQQVVIPFEEVPDPEHFIADFLKKQASVKDKFVQFQTQRVKLTGRLPEPMDLEADLKEMDSGVKNNKETYYIRFFYEAALEDYMKLIEVDRNYGRRGMRMEREQPPPITEYPMNRGVPVTRGRYEQIEYPRSHTPSSWMEDEFLRLREEVRRREDDDRRRQERENTELKTQLLQLQQQMATGGGGNPRLEQKLEQMEADRRRMEEQYAQLKENTLLDRIRQIETMARSGPSSEEIKAWLKDTVNEYRSQLMVEKNLEDLIEKKLQIHGQMGPTQTEVELEKARNDLVLGQKKLEIEEKKASQWGDTLKNVAGVFG
jgi:hypothetical protein